MARFNTKDKPLSTKTTNIAGGTAFKESTKLEFVSALLTSFVKDKFYKTADEQIADMEKLIDGISDKKFIAKAAIYARNEFGMRSISHVVAAILADRAKGTEWFKHFMDKVVKRPDDVTEIVSFYHGKYGRMQSHGMRKGISLALRKFDAYTLAKYRGEGNAISLIDVVNLSRPKPSDKNSEALALLVKGELKSAETWESKLSSAGQKADGEADLKDLKAEAWKDLIENKKLGHFALLRNLRNIAKQAYSLLPQALEQLCNPVAIKKSLVLPFRYATAVEQFNNSENGSREIIQALNKALDISCANVPAFEGKMLIAIDHSGSMNRKGTAGGDKTPREIASLFGAILAKSNNADVMTFSDSVKWVAINPDDSTLTIAKQIAADYHPAGTNFNLMFEEAKKAYDRIIILSDMQGWMASPGMSDSLSGAPTKALANYSAKFSVNPFIYSWDLQGLGTLMFPQNRVLCLAGFSDKVFDLMKMVEQDRNILINTIESIEL